jgi:hypothetical protein
VIIKVGIISLMFLALGAALVLRSQAPELGALVLAAGVLIQGFMSGTADERLPRGQIPR